MSLRPSTGNNLIVTRAPVVTALWAISWHLFQLAAAFPAADPQQHGLDPVAVLPRKTGPREPQALAVDLLGADPRALHRALDGRAQDVALLEVVHTLAQVPAVPVRRPLSMSRSRFSIFGSSVTTIHSRAYMSVRALSGAVFVVYIQIIKILGVSLLPCYLA